MGADSSKFEEIAGMPLWVRAKPSFPYESDLLIRRSISQITRRLVGSNISLFTEFYDVFYQKMSELEQPLSSVSFLLAHDMQRKSAFLVHLLKICLTLTRDARNRKRPDSLRKTLLRLMGRSHRRLLPEHYFLIGEALFHALAKCDPAWADSAVRAAWVNTYSLLLHLAVPIALARRQRGLPPGEPGDSDEDLPTPAVRPGGESPYRHNADLSDTLSPTSSLNPRLGGKLKGSKTLSRTLASATKRGGRILASKRAGTPPPRPMQRQGAQRNGLAAAEAASGESEEDSVLTRIEDDICGALSPTDRQAVHSMLVFLRERAGRRTTFDELEAAVGGAFAEKHMLQVGSSITEALQSSPYLRVNFQFRTVVLLSKFLRKTPQHVTSLRKAAASPRTRNGGFRTYSRGNKFQFSSPPPPSSSSAHPDEQKSVSTPTSLQRTHRASPSQLSLSSSSSSSYRPYENGINGSSNSIGSEFSNSLSIPELHQSIPPISLSSPKKKRFGSNHHRSYSSYPASSPTQKFSPKPPPVKVPAASPSSAASPPKFSLRSPRARKLFSQLSPTLSAAAASFGGRDHRSQQQQQPPPHCVSPAGLPPSMPTPRALAHAAADVHFSRSQKSLRGSPRSPSLRSSADVARHLRHKTYDGSHVSSSRTGDDDHTSAVTLDDLSSSQWVTEVIAARNSVVGSPATSGQASPSSSLISPEQLAGIGGNTNGANASTAAGASPPSPRRRSAGPAPGEKSSGASTPTSPSSPLYATMPRNRFSPKVIAARARRRSSSSRLDKMFGAVPGSPSRSTSHSRRPSLRQDLALNPPGNLGVRTTTSANASPSIGPLSSPTCPANASLIERASISSGLDALNSLASIGIEFDRRLLPRSANLTPRGADKSRQADGGTSTPTRRGLFRKKRSSLPKKLTRGLLRRRTSDPTGQCVSAPRRRFSFSRSNTRHAEQPPLEDFETLLREANAAGGRAGRRRQSAFAVLTRKRSLSARDTMPIHLFAARGAHTPPASNRRNSRSLAVAAVRRSLSLLIGGNSNSSGSNANGSDNTAAAIVPTSLAVDDDALSGGISQPVPVYTDYSSARSSMSHTPSGGSSRDRSRRSSFDPSKSDPSSSEFSSSAASTNADRGRSRSTSSTSTATSINEVPSYSSSQSSHRPEGHPSRAHMMHKLRHLRAPGGVLPGHSRSPSGSASASRSISSSFFSQPTRARAGSNSSQRSGASATTTLVKNHGSPQSTTASIESRSEGRPYTTSSTSSRSPLTKQNSSSSIKSDSRPHVSNIFRTPKGTTPTNDGGKVRGRPGYHKPQQSSLSSSVSSVASDSSAWPSNLHQGLNLLGGHASSSWPASHAGTPTGAAAAKNKKLTTGSNPLTPVSRLSNGVTPLPFHMRTSSEHHTPRQEAVPCGASSARISILRPTSHIESRPRSDGQRSREPPLSDVSTTSTVSDASTTTPIPSSLSSSQFSPSVKARVAAYGGVRTPPTPYTSGSGSSYKNPRSPKTTRFRNLKSGGGSRRKFSQDSSSGVGGDDADGGEAASDVHHGTERVKSLKQVRPLPPTPPRSRRNPPGRSRSRSREEPAAKLTSTSSPSSELEAAIAAIQSRSYSAPIERRNSTGKPSSTANVLPSQMSSMNGSQLPHASASSSSSPTAPSSYSALQTLLSQFNAAQTPATAAPKDKDPPSTRRPPPPQALQRKRSLVTGGPVSPALRSPSFKSASSQRCHKPHTNSWSSSTARASKLASVVSAPLATDSTTATNDPPPLDAAGRVQSHARSRSYGSSRSDPKLSGEPSIKHSHGSSSSRPPLMRPRSMSPERTGLEERPVFPRRAQSSGSRPAGNTSPRWHPQQYTGSRSRTSRSKSPPLMPAKTDVGILSSLRSLRRSKTPPPVPSSPTRDRGLAFASPDPIAKLADLMNQHSPRNGAAKSPDNMWRSRSTFPEPALTDDGAARSQSAEQHKRKRPKIPQRASTIVVAPLPCQAQSQPQSRRSGYASDPYDDSDGGRRSRHESRSPPPVFGGRDTRGSSIDYAADSGGESEGTSNVGALSRVFGVLRMNSQVFSRGNNSHTRHMSAMPATFSNAPDHPRSPSPEQDHHEEDVIEPLSRKRGRLRISKKVKRWRQRRKSLGAIKSPAREHTDGGDVDNTPSGAKSDSETIPDGVTTINLSSPEATNDNAAGYLSDPNYSFTGSIGSSGSLGTMVALGAVSDAEDGTTSPQARRPSRSPEPSDSRGSSKKYRSRLRRSRTKKSKKKKSKSVPKEQPSVDETLPPSLLNATPMQSAVLSAAEAEAEAEAEEESASAGVIGDDEESDVVLSLPRSNRTNANRRQPSHRSLFSVDWESSSNARGAPHDGLPPAPPRGAYKKRESASQPTTMHSRQGSEPASASSVAPARNTAPRLGKSTARPYSSMSPPPPGSSGSGVDRRSPRPFASASKSAQAAARASRTPTHGVSNRFSRSPGDPSGRKSPVMRLSDRALESASPTGRKSPLVSPKGSSPPRAANRSDPSMGGISNRNSRPSSPRAPTTPKHRSAYSTSLSRSFVSPILSPSSPHQQASKHAARTHAHAHASTSPTQQQRHSTGTTSGTKSARSSLSASSSNFSPRKSLSAVAPALVSASFSLGGSRSSLHARQAAAAAIGSTSISMESGSASSEERQRRLSPITQGKVVTFPERSSSPVGAKNASKSSSKESKDAKSASPKPKNKSSRRNRNGRASLGRLFMRKKSK